MYLESNVLSDSITQLSKVFDIINTPKYSNQLKRILNKIHMDSAILDELISNTRFLRQTGQFITEIGYKYFIGLTIILIITNYLKIYSKGKKSILKKGKKDNARGILFGTDKRQITYSPTNDEGHIIVFGGSGTGKTSALLIPTLRSWDGTSFTIDIAGDICKNVNMPNKLIYEPDNPQSIPYNIFGAIDCLCTDDDQNEALEQLAFLLMPDNINMSDTSLFFNTEGRKILTASLIAFYHAGFDFIQICEKIVYNSWQNLFQEIEMTNNYKAIQYIYSFHGTSAQNTAGCKQSCDSVLKLFATNINIKHAIKRPLKGEECFTPQKLETHNVFVVIEDYKLKLYSPLLQIITSQSLEFFSTRSNDANKTILFALDEFASLGKMDITDALRKLRKKHVRIMVLTQSMADIDLIYGRDERMAMLNNFRFKTILSADDTDTQEYFAKLIGYKNIQRRSTSRNAKSVTRTINEVKDYIIQPSELAHLDKHLVLLHPGGYIKIKKNFYYLG